MAKKSKEFKDLQDFWYKKLADTPNKDGEKFVDIEINEYALKFPLTDIYRYHNEETFKAKQDYYQMAYQFLNSYTFDVDLNIPGANKAIERFLAKHKHNKSLDQAIWEYHTNAVSVRDIAHILNKAKASVTNRTYVNYIITALQYKMFAARLLEELDETAPQ